MFLTAFFSISLALKSILLVRVILDSFKIARAEKRLAESTEKLECYVGQLQIMKLAQ